MTRLLGHKVAPVYMSFSHLSPFQLVLFIFSCWEMSDMWGIGGKKVNLPNIFLHFSFALYFAKGICGLDFEEQIFAVNAGNQVFADEAEVDMCSCFFYSICLSVSTFLGLIYLLKVFLSACIFHIFFFSEYFIHFRKERI